MAKNRSSSFNVTDGLFDNTQDVHEVQQSNTPLTANTHEVQQVHEVQKEIGTTQGKKGFKLKRINMAFSDVNHEYITKESRRQGISSTAFVNMIIDAYRTKH